MSSNGKVVVTGGTGYIGSFTVLALIEAGYEAIIVDNCYNSHAGVLQRISYLTKQPAPKHYKVDITQRDQLEKVFVENPDIHSVIHFAALKAVGESCEIPADYWRVNIGGTVNLLACMKKYGVNNIVFSSSATVYGEPEIIPIPEELLEPPVDNTSKPAIINGKPVFTCKPTSPYGHTKVACEDLITAQIVAWKKAASKEGKDASKYNAALLRYFNPAGAHPTGLMGENPLGKPFNLLPLAAQVALGKRESLAIFGTDWKQNPNDPRQTQDGTCIRDYLHVLDLASGHLQAMKYLSRNKPGVRAWNLGTGTGSTVRQVIDAFNKTIGFDMVVKEEARRDGDVPNLTARPDRANEELEWSAKYTLQDACEDLWLWTINNPEGYAHEFNDEHIKKLAAAKAKADGERQEKAQRPARQ